MRVAVNAAATSGGDGGLAFTDGVLGGKCTSSRVRSDATGVCTGLAGATRAADLAVRSRLDARRALRCPAA